MKNYLMNLSTGDDRVLISSSFSWLFGGITSGGSLYGDLSDLSEPVIQVIQVIPGHVTRCLLIRLSNRRVYKRGA